MKKKNEYKKYGFFDFMHEVIWPQITRYIDEHEDDEEFNKDYNYGRAALILAYGDGGIAHWGTRDAQYQRVGNILFESLRQGIMTREELEKLYKGVLEHYQEYADGTKKI